MSTYTVWLDYILKFFTFQILNVLTQKIGLQEELGFIMENLDEIILTKSENSLNFCNKNGMKILENIEEILRQ